MCYSIEPRTRKYVKWYEFLLFARNLFVKYRKEVSSIARKKGLDTAKAASTKVVRKIVEEQVNS